MYYSGVQVNRFSLKSCNLCNTYRSAALWCCYWAQRRLLFQLQQIIGQNMKSAALLVCFYYSVRVCYNHLCTFSASATFYRGLIFSCKHIKIGFETTTCTNRYEGLYSEMKDNVQTAIDKADGSYVFGNVEGMSFSILTVTIF
jgi:hypothetical protein